MTKFLNFTIAETSGRTFEVPMDKVLELVEQYKRDYSEYENKDIDIDITDSYDLAKVLMDYPDDIANYELNNDYVDWEIADSKIIGE